MVAGLQSDYRNDEPPADWNLDLTAAEFDGYPDVTNGVVRVGRDEPLSWACIGAGAVVGQQPRDLTWNEMHDDVVGGGYRVVTRAGQWTRVDGSRVDNVEDAFLPRGGIGNSMHFSDPTRDRGRGGNGARVAIRFAPRR